MVTDGRGTATLRDGPAQEKTSSLASVLDEIRSGAHAHEALPPLFFTTPEGPQPVPFEGFLRPFLQAGVGHLRNALAQAVCAQAETELVMALVRRLQAVCTRTLMLELNVARMLDRLEGSSPQERFESFSHAHWRDLENLFALLEEYPVLARLMATTVERWVEVTAEFCDRVLADRAQLSETFCQGADIGAVASAEAGLSDLHRGGRSVIKVQFSSGTTVMYKPRSLEVEVAFQQLLTYLNSLGLPLPHRTLRVIDRSDYGWVEFAGASGCESHEELERFYWRQGSYLALLYVLEAVDFHQENLIACGEYPVLVDLEALLHPGPVSSRSERAYDKAMQFLGRSVLRVGLLPLPIMGQDGKRGIDISGLGGEPGQLTPRPVPMVVDGYTDTMRIAGQFVEVAGSQNRPHLGGDQVTTADFVETIVGGFQETYGLLRRHRDALVPLLLQFGDIEVRHIVRPTRHYALLLQESRHPDYLRDGIDRDRFLDKLWAETAVRPALERLVPAEQRDLQLGDIPLFTTRPGQRHLWDARGECIPDYFEVDGLTEALEQLAALDDQDCAVQETLIRTSLVRIQHSAVKESVADDGSRAPSPDELLQAAATIGETLSASAIRGPADACWIGVDLESLNDFIWQLSPAGNDLYSGVGGIALFLGYLGAATGRGDFEELARAALEPIRDQLRKPDSDEYAHVGAFSGHASQLYVLQHLASLWDDASLLDEALAGLPTVSRGIPSDRRFDIMGGAAGCAVVLLGLHEQAPEPEIMEAAWLCGERLLEAETPQQVGSGWLVGGEPPALAGFSHGVTGIAWALSRLADATGDERFRHAAHRGWAYERALYVSERGNWRDLRRADADDFMPADWCHGAPGAALGRLLALPFDDSPAVREEAMAGIETTLHEGFGRSHCLCHGDLGNLDILMLADEVLGETRWRGGIQRRLSSLTTHVEVGRWQCGLPGADAVIPGFMPGLAGIGYGLLRLWSREAVPSVLWLEPPRARTAGGR